MVLFNVTKLLETCNQGLELQEKAQKPKKKKNSSKNVTTAAYIAVINLR